jgi:hypothetical protein
MSAVHFAAPGIGALILRNSEKVDLRQTAASFATEANMADETLAVTEDAFHRLQTPHPDDPHSDENLANAAQLAILAAEPALRGRVRVSVSGARATLQGDVDNAEQRRRAVEAVRVLGNTIAGIKNMLTIATEAGNLREPAITRERPPGQDLVYVTRFCGVDASSITAAVNDAIRCLDRSFTAQGLQRPGEVIVLYRNRLPESVVIDVGYAIASGGMVETTDEELRIGRTPEGEMISTFAAAGEPLFEAQDRLIRHARRSGFTVKNVAWQRYSLATTRPREQPASPLYVPVS